MSNILKIEEVSKRIGATVPYTRELCRKGIIKANSGKSFWRSGRSCRFGKLFDFKKIELYYRRNYQHKRWNIFLKITLKEDEQESCNYWNGNLFLHRNFT